jgi:TRAP-type C4-dicarboxylate transport system permease small subunit
LEDKQMRLVTIILDAVEKTQRFLTLVFFLLTIGLVAFQVFNRFWLQLPVLWTSDAAVISFVWLALLSASTAVRSGGHFRVTALIDTEFMSGTPRWLLELLALIAIIGLSLVLLIQGSEFALAGAREQSPGLRVSMLWAYISVPLCSLTAILFALERIWLLFRTRQARRQPLAEAKVV